MKKRFKIMCLAFLTVVFALIIGLNVGDKKAGIEGNKIGFHYPLFYVRLVMGEPDEVSTFSEAGVKTYQYYDRTFWGRKGSIAYSAHFYGVDRVDLILNIDENEADTLFSMISQSIESKYKDETGYYCNSVDRKENGELIQKIGVNKGAYGLSFTISYWNGILELYGNDER